MKWVRELAGHVSGAKPYVPVIIVGAARSGTNVLRDSLVRLDGFNTWPCDEINFVWRHGNRSFPTDELEPEHATATVRRYIRAQFDKLARQTGADYVVEKTCANSLRVGFVRRVFPEAKFINIVRDGRDVVASAAKRWKAPFEFAYTMRKARFVPAVDLPFYAGRYALNRFSRLGHRERRLGTWGPRFAGMDDLKTADASLEELCAAQWSRSVSRTDEALKELKSDQLIVLRYEDFVTHPHQELERIGHFLGVRNPTSLRGVDLGVTARSIGNWKRGLDEPSRVFKRIKVQLAAHGYV